MVKYLLPIYVGLHSELQVDAQIGFALRSPYFYLGFLLNPERFLFAPKFMLGQLCGPCEPGCLQRTTQAKTSPDPLENFQIPT